MRKRILILSNHFITLYNFRKELIKKLIDDNNEVYISLPKSEENTFFSDIGCKIIETAVDRRGVNPLKDFKLIFNYIKIMKNIDPDIILSYTIKPNIYGSIASNMTGYKQINNVTGTGATFLKDNFVSNIVMLLYKLSVKKSYKVFFQNNGDKDFFVKNKMVNDNWAIIPGSGVNLEHFEFCDLPSENIINFIFVGRVMKLKGIDEYLECAKSIKQKYENTNFFVAGFIEECKYTKIIEDFSKKGLIDYIGYQKDIRPFIKKCHCVILPSHGGEGIPNVLLESASMGRICIASDINGSNDVISNCETGFLFNNGNWQDLANKVEKFLSLRHDEKAKMGLLGREKIESKFNRNIVIDSYIKEISKI
ncbi:MAG: glycosyltransferase family 4 protein [Acidaminococcaceae bacterium]